MAIIITPAFEADTVVLEGITIQYTPTWDGAVWVLTNPDISIFGRGILAGDAGNGVSSIDITISFNDLTAAGQTAVLDLYGIVEQELADKVQGI